MNPPFICRSGSSGMRWNFSSGCCFGPLSTLSPVTLDICGLTPPDQNEQKADSMLNCLSEPFRCWVMVRWSCKFGVSPKFWSVLDTPTVVSPALDVGGVRLKHLRNPCRKENNVEPSIVDFCWVLMKLWTTKATEFLAWWKKTLRQFFSVGSSRLMGTRVKPPPLILMGTTYNHFKLSCWAEERRGRKTPDFIDFPVYISRGGLMVCFSLRNRMGLINQQKDEIPCCVERFELVRRREIETVPESWLKRW